GVESSGMICSAKELGITDPDNGGILVLPKETVVGIDAKTLFEKEDYILDFEMLPNQSYGLSHMALARELCAFYNLPFKPLKTNNLKAEGYKSVSIEIENPEYCSRYSAIVLKNVEAVETPDWIKSRLRAMDTNPKNNLLIDVSNYVMFEMGHPTHCFDLDKLAGQMIKVRFPKAGETLNTLDNQDIKLTENFLVIADSEKPVALAGIIGGSATAVSQETKNILIEAAWFKPALIKKTSRLTGIKTESSYRFERGADIEITMLSANRIAQIIIDVCPQASLEVINDNYPSKYQPKVIEVDSDKINSILGTNLSDAEIFNSLKAIQPNLKDSTPWQFQVPSYRLDMEDVCDVAEETGRFMGYDIIPSKSEMKMMKASATSSFMVVSDLQNKFSNLGFSEVYNYDFISSKEIKNCLLKDVECVDIKNPLSLEYQFLRTSLVCGLLKTLKYNLNRQMESVSIFEVGNVYSKEGQGHKEETRFAGLMHGIAGERFWKSIQENADFYHLKGVLGNVFKDFDNLKFVKASDAPAFMHSGNSLEILLRGKCIGFMGQLNPKVSSINGFKNNNIWYFEFSLTGLIALHQKDFHLNIKQIRPVSEFPVMWRDLSIVLDKNREWADIEKAVSKIPNLIEIELIDVYKGKNIEENLKSITIRFIFSSMEKTLTDEEVSSYMSEILGKLKKTFDAKLRD
ncbi:MAG: phenylalanine--tRNA ligase subunit beta, partial [Elusimicrobia bacterium]|nr:phenylalanine--tRNA ligase subunit beta [Elusimicrobiota bacterium]